MTKKKIFVAAIIAIIFAFISGLAPIKGSQVFAVADTETTKVYNLKFDYEYFKIYSYTYTGHFTFTSENWTDDQYKQLTTGNDVTTVPIMHDAGSTKDFSISIYGEVPNYTVESETLSKGACVNFKTINIKVPSICQGGSAGRLAHDYRYRITQLSNSKGEMLVNDKYKTKWSDQGPEVVYTGALPEDIYTLHFEYSNWNNSWINYHKITTTFSVDKNPPTISGASTSTTGKYTNQGFTVTATDSVSGVANLYWKNSVSTTYSSLAGSRKTVAAGSPNGLYSFYAVDKAGNRSSTYYVYYDNVAPAGKVTTSNGETIANGGTTNETFTYTVTENGSGLNTLYYKTPSSSSWKTCTSGKIIDSTAEAGEYSFKATDKSGNSEIYTVTLLDPCSAGHDYVSNIVYPTCTSGGYTKYTCSRCGAMYTDNTVSALGHSYKATTTAASCTNGGYTSYTCTRCGHSYTGNMTPAAGHSYTAEVTSPTCTSGGYTTYTCTKCGNSYTGSTTPAAGHSYTGAVAAPTCTSKGYTIYTCTKCGYSYTGNTIAALGHSYSAVTVSSTCTKGGNTTYKCTRCGVSHTDNPTQATGHSYVASIVEATCTQRGYTTFTCTKCNDTYRDNETAPLGHNYVSEHTAASCTARGYTTYICTRCGENYESGYTQPTGHSYVTTTVAATCTEGGYSLHTCSICGKRYKDNITQPLGHNYTSATREATCTQGGGTVYTCQICGYEYSDNNGTYPKGHNYTTTIITSPTCTTKGLRRSVCDDCGDSYDTVIAANGHNYVISDGVSGNGITTRTYTCTKCNHSYKQELGDQYEEVSNYVEYLFEQYSPYMWWVLLAAAGVWSIVMGVFFAIAQKNEDKEKARKMVINYVIGLVVIAIIVVACPYLVRGIAALVT